MTAFEVYLVMQASTVVVVLASAGMVALIVGAITWGAARAAQNKRLERMLVAEANKRGFEK